MLPFAGVRASMPTLQVPRTYTEELKLSCSHRSQLCHILSVNNVRIDDTIGAVRTTPEACGLRTVLLLVLSGAIAFYVENCICKVSVLVAHM